MLTYKQVFIQKIRYLYYKYLLTVMDDKKYKNWCAKKNNHKVLDLENPKTFDEKIWCLNLLDNENLDLKTKCTDKVLVRDYIRECGFNNILNEVYGVYDSFDEIDFTAIPSEAFFKCNHISGGGIIYNKEQTNLKTMKRYFDLVLKENYYYFSRERNYKNIKPKIICEKVIRDKNNQLPLDYKFMCFNGKPMYLFLDIGCCDISGSHKNDYLRNIYDMNFNPTSYRETRDSDFTLIKKPDNWDEMMNIAEKLCKPFKHCRIDLYNVDSEKIIFGEITFYHGGALNNFSPEEWDLYLGNLIEI